MLVSGNHFGFQLLPFFALTFGLLSLQAQDRSIRLTFAGDLMAHVPNFTIEPFDAIYENIRYIIQSDDLSFVNLEFPIDDSVAYSSYPLFNVHSEYPLAAIKAGFDVFSLANNHAADRGGKGVPKTQAAMNVLQAKVLNEWNRSINFNGLRPSADSPPYVLTIIEKAGLRIGFVAVAEWVNIPSLRNWVQYADFRETPSPENFLKWLQMVRPSVDLLVLSYHWGEEYQNRQNEARAGFSRRLVDAGVDIIWGNHPHVLQPWYILESQRGQALVLPSCGNFISGQTWFLGPGDALRDDAPKGDSMLFGLTVSINAQGKIGFAALDPVLIAAWKTARGQMVVRTMADLARNTDGPWRKYFRTRLGAMTKLIPQSIEPSALLGLPEPVSDRNIPD